MSSAEAAVCRSNCARAGEADSALATTARPFGVSLGSAELVAGQEDRRHRARHALHLEVGLFAIASSGEVSAAVEVGDASELPPVGLVVLADHLLGGQLDPTVGVGVSETCSPPADGDRAGGLAGVAGMDGWLDRAAVLTH